MQWNFVVRPSADTAVVVVFMFFVLIIGGLGIRECRRDEEARQRQRAFEQTDLLTLTGSLAAVFEVPPHVRSYRIDYPAMVCQILYEREGKCAQWRYKPARQAAVTFSAPTLNLTEFRSAVIVRSISQERKTYVSETRKQDLYKIDKEV